MIKNPLFHRQMNIYAVGSMDQLKEIALLTALIFFLFLFLTFPVLSSRDKDAQIIISEGHLVEEKIIGNYTYRHYVGPPHDYSVYQLFQGDQLSYQSEVGFEFSLYPEDNYYSHSDDITGDGIPNILVIEVGGGGSGMRDKCHVLSLGEQCKLIQELPVGNFADLNQDGILEYLARDHTFTHWQASYSESPDLRLTLAYKDGQYVLSPSLMVKPLPSQEVIAQKVQEVKEECCKLTLQESSLHCWHQGQVYLAPSVWSFMLDLLYSGHSQEAMDFLDAVWPEGEERKESFLIAFKRSLNQSDDWQIIADVLYQTPEEKALWTIEEEKRTGQFKILSSPEGAIVALDGERKGMTNLILYDIPVGAYTLTLNRLGYEDWERKLLVYSNRVNEVNVRLVARSDNAHVRIWITPNEEADIFIDGEHMGKRTMFFENFPQGKHTIRVTKEGYRDWEDTLTFSPGENYILSVDLEEIPEEVHLLDHTIWIPIGLLLFMFLI